MMGLIYIMVAKLNKTSIDKPNTHPEQPNLLNYTPDKSFKTASLYASFEI